MAEIIERLVVEWMDAMKNKEEPVRILLLSCAHRLRETPTAENPTDQLRRCEACEQLAVHNEVSHADCQPDEPCQVYNAKT